MVIASLHSFFHSGTWFVIRNLLIFFAVVFWLAVAYWVYKDARRRIEDYEQRCPVCRAAVDPSFLVCPVCTTKLKQSCESCKAPLEPLWQVCPYCETAVSRQPPVDLSATVASLESDPWASFEPTPAVRTPRRRRQPPRK